MTRYLKQIEPDQVNKGATSAREEAARQIRESQAAAEDVANLCARAVNAARHHKIPHAGVGGADITH